ncbi:MAG TPA: hypothetical protein VGI00_14165 [Streptosporangiaceae bacterium]|jgi:hypothetical protein
MTQEPDEIDPRNNPESELAEESASQTVSRSSSGGPIFSGLRPADAVPGQSDLPDGDRESGTSGGNPLEGVLIDPDDAEEAVPGDEGPEHPGQR